MNEDQIAAIRAKKRQAANQLPQTTNEGLDVVIGKNKTLGGYDIKRADGTVVLGARSQTNASMGIGKVVSTYRGNRQTLVDAKPVGVVSGTNSTSGTDSTSGTGTGSGTGTVSGSVLPPTVGGNTNDGSKPRYRPDPTTGECTPKYYLGDTKPGDYDTPQDCAGNQPNSKSYYCEGGKCYATAPGSGKYDNLEDCEAAIIKPTFTGGQCPVDYNVITQGNVSTIP